MPPSPESPLHGRCACGGVRFTVTAPFESARSCHCHRCQRRTGTSSAANARLPVSAFQVEQGEELLRYWKPPDGQAKWYCVECGGQVFSRPAGQDHVLR